jgi:hypothetical protein
MVECATFGGEESPVLGAIVGGGAVAIAAIVLGGTCLYMKKVAAGEGVATRYLSDFISAVPTVFYSSMLDARCWL